MNSDQACDHGRKVGGGNAYSDNLNFCAYGSLNYFHHNISLFYRVFEDAGQRCT